MMASPSGWVHPGNQEGKHREFLRGISSDPYPKFTSCKRVSCSLSSTCSFLGIVG